jgi:Predicted dehydrogenases and related proteins
MNRAKIALVGTGRMGAIRAKLMYGNPRIDLCGIVDVNPTSAEKLANTYDVSLTFNRM